MRAWSGAPLRRIRHRIDVGQYGARKRYYPAMKPVTITESKENGPTVRTLSPHAIPDHVWNKDAHNKYVEGIFAAEEISIKSESRQVDNAGGFTIMEKLDGLKSDLEALKSDHKVLLSSWMHVRASELEAASGHVDAQARFQRNSIVHRGDVKRDLRVFDFLESNRLEYRLKKASDGFQVLYGVSVDKLRPRIGTAPSEIVRFLDTRGSLEVLHQWKKFPEERKTWISVCDRNVNSWLNTKDGDLVTYPIQQVGEEYDKLCREMKDKSSAMKDE